MRAIELLTILLVSTGASIPPPCDETETLYQVEGDFRYLTIYDVTDKENFADLFESFVESEDGTWQGCLAKGSCFMAEVEQHPGSDAVTFKQDGALVESRSAFPLFDSFTTFVELGDCIPTCDSVSDLIVRVFASLARLNVLTRHYNYTKETESLLEFDVFAGFNTSPTWWIQDKDNNRVIECEQVRDSCMLHSYVARVDFHRIRHCLPSSECHWFVAGDRFSTPYRDSQTAFNLTFHGELLASRDGFRFESIPLGGGCKEMACENDNDTMLEVFIYRDFHYNYELPNMTLLVMDGKDSLFQDMVDPEGQDLFYHRTCLPKDSCLNVTLSVPETYNLTSQDSNYMRESYHEMGELQVAFDNVIFRDSEFRLGKMFGEDDEYIFHDTTLAGNCDIAGLCNSSELRLDVTLHAPDDDLSRYERFYAWVEYTDEQVSIDRTDPLDLSDMFAGYMSGKIYRTTQCIPSDEGTAFVSDNNDEWSQSFEYTILVNGEEREERRLEERYLSGSQYIVTALGGETGSQELSSGAIAGIVIGSLAGVALVGYVGYIVYKRRNVTEHPASEEEISQKV